MLLQSKMNRNSPCSCGSGKKFKHCCGLQKTVSITSIIEREIVELQVEFIQYAMDEFESQIQQDYFIKVKELALEDEDEMEFFQFVHTVWFALFYPIDRDTTILTLFINEKLPFIKREKMKELLPLWVGARAFAGRILAIQQDTLQVRDALTEEIMEIQLLEEFDSKENAFIFAILVPYEEKWILFPTAFDFEGEGDGKEEHFIQNEFRTSNYDDAELFLNDGFLELMNVLPYAMMEFGSAHINWKDPTYKEVAQLFEEGMRKVQAPLPLIATGIILWHVYCETEPRLIKKKNTYAAAIHYLNWSVDPIVSVTKKEIAELYQISPSTLGTAIDDLEYELHEELKELKETYMTRIVDDLESLGDVLPFDHPLWDYDD